MNTKIRFSFWQVASSIALFGMIASPAFAQDDSMRSQTTNTSLSPTALENEAVGVRPQLGVINFQDGSGDRQTRPTIGATVDVNALKFVNISGIDSSRWAIGPTAGFFFSHLSGLGSNYYQAPLNAKVGYFLTPQLRVGGHTGGIVTLRSTAKNMNFGDTTPSDGNQVDLYWNIGADVDLALTETLSLTARPDWMFTGGGNVFTGTLALALSFGSA